MMSTLTDRYVGEVLRGVPTGQRADVEQELRASIADAVDAADGGADAGISAPADPGSGAMSAEARALTELGDPARLAASLTDGPQYLIGPGLYWDYRRLLRALLMIVPGVVTLTVSTVQAFTGTPPLEVLIDGLGMFLIVAAQVVFWTTLGFVIAEHTGTREMPDRRPWTVEDLPKRPARQVTLGETVGTVLGLLVGIAALVWQRSGAQVSDSGLSIPLLDPDLWTFWLPALLVLMSAGVVLQLLAYARGRWTPALAGLRVAGDLVFGVVGIALLMTQPVLNPAFFAELGQVQWADPGSPLAQGIAWVIGVGVALDVLDIVRKARA
jgi:hypothetical protein